MLLCCIPFNSKRISNFLLGNVQQNVQLINLEPCMEFCVCVKMGLQCLVDMLVSREMCMINEIDIPQCLVSIAVWFGVIFIRHGLYQDGVFKFTVYIPDNYPDGDCPRVVFDTPVFHPLVDPVSGELDVRRAFTKWRRNHNHIWQVLMYARTVFYKINTMDPLNPEAAVLYDKDIQLFKSKVVDSVKLCNSHLFDQPKIDDPYAISFSPWNPAVHEEAKEKMFAHKRRPEDYNKGLPVSGLSWVKPGSTQPFSKEDNPLQT
uniref:Akt interacting protein n=1 Tax=Cyprinus carpio TaxID=7962 RepID=A0A8C1R6C8_CYPCA